MGEFVLVEVPGFDYGFEISVQFIFRSVLAVLVTYTVAFFWSLLS